VLDELEVYRGGRNSASPDSVGSFILSNTESVSDILGLLLLARCAGLTTIRRTAVKSSAIDIVPLFETIDDLRRSHNTLRSLLQNRTYRLHLKLRGDRQEIMIGYSDSSKDGGIVSSAFELYEAQIRLDDVASEFGIRLTFFHGRGGSISRGGGPVYESMVAQPRETMTGRIRITEQGEMISAKYLVPETARYNLEVLTAAAFYCMSTPMSSSARQSREMYRSSFSSISAAAREAYGSLTRHPDFWHYFTTATPIDVVERIEIGSRPISRAPRMDIGSIRAIPWVFAWTQCRQAITGWYGFGSAIESAVRSGEITWTELRKMYSRWPFFRSLVRNIEMVLVKTDLNVAERYLPEKGDRRNLAILFRRILLEYERSRTAVLRIKRQAILLENDIALRQSLMVRNPYLDPLSFIQARFLRDFRNPQTSGDRKKKLLDLLRSSINGIAAGMRNTG
jgi:phosphoenolpyruvate carboxylase